MFCSSHLISSNVPKCSYVICRVNSLFFHFPNRNTTLLILLFLSVHYECFVFLNCFLCTDGFFIVFSSLSFFTGNFTCLEVIFVLKRRLGYYLFHTYIPTCLIVIMSVSTSCCSGVVNLLLTSFIVK